MTAAHTVGAVTVEHATTLGGTWTVFSQARVVEFSKSGTGAVGRCVLEWDLGQIGRAVTAVPQAAELVSVPAPGDSQAAELIGWLAGQWVRLKSGSTVLAWYRIITWAVVPGGGSGDSADGVARYEGVCPLGVLDQVFIWGFPEIAAGGSSSIPFRVLPANSSALGNRSASTVGGLYVMDPRAITPRARWTAQQYLETLFASVLPGGTTLSLRQSGCLDYLLERFDGHSHTVAQVLSDLCGAKRGLSYFATVSGANIVVSVGSAVTESISAGGFTLPAATPASVDLADDPEISGVQVSVDDTGRYDLIELHGEQPWCMVTLSTGTSLEPHWEAAEETLWNEIPGQRLARRVHREWRIRGTWTGVTYLGSDGVRNLPEVGGGFFSLGYNGNISWNSSADAVHPQSLELTQQLPETIGQGAYYGDYGSDDLLVIAGSGSTWEEKPWRASVESEPARVILDDGNNGTDIAAAINAGLGILVTVGIREPRPLIVSHLIDDGFTSPLRHLVQRIPGIEQWRIVPGAVTGVLNTGALRTATGYFRRDDLPVLQRRAALAAAWYGQPQVTAQWADGNGLAAFQAYAHGSLLELSCGWDFPGPLQVRTVTCRAVGGYWQTIIQAARTAPDYQLAVPVPPRMAEARGNLGAINILRPQ